MEGNGRAEERQPMERLVHIAVDSNRMPFGGRTLQPASTQHQVIRDLPPFCSKLMIPPKNTTLTLAGIKGRSTNLLVSMPRWVSHITAMTKWKRSISRRKKSQVATRKIVSLGSKKDGEEHSFE